MSYPIGIAVPEDLTKSKSALKKQKALKTFIANKHGQVFKSWCEGDDAAVKNALVEVSKKLTKEAKQPYPKITRAIKIRIYPNQQQKLVIGANLRDPVDAWNMCVGLAHDGSLWKIALPYMIVRQKLWDEDQKLKLEKDINGADIKKAEKTQSEKDAANPSKALIEFLEHHIAEFINSSSDEYKERVSPTPVKGVIPLFVQTYVKAIFGVKATKTKRAGAPKFKTRASAHRKSSVTLQATGSWKSFTKIFNDTERHINIPKLASRLGPLKFRDRGTLIKKYAQNPSTTIEYVTLTREYDKYYAVLTVCGIPKDEAILDHDDIAESKGVGVDRGVHKLAALDNGELLGRRSMSEVEYLEREMDKLKSTMSRQEEEVKKLGLVRKGIPLNPKSTIKYQRRKADLIKMQNRVQNLKSEAANRIANRIVSRSQGFVAMESLNISGMTKSNKGTVEEPGKNREQNKAKNRSNLRQGWGILENKIFDKCDEAGVPLVFVRAAYTSQACNACGHVDADNRHGDKFACVKCGHRDDADINAAKNIRDAGKKLLLKSIKAIATP